MRSDYSYHVTSLGKSEASSRKRKTSSQQPPGVREKEDITGLGLTPKMFSRKLCPTEATLVSASSTQLHTHDPNFVPDTLQVTEGLPTTCQHDQDDMKTTVPDTPEKSQDDPFPSSANNERPGSEENMKQRSVRIKSSNKKDVLRKSKAKKKLAKRLKKSYPSAELDGKIMNNVAVTSYEVAMNDRPASSSILWRYIVVDEGHRLKNRNRNRKQNRKTRFSRPFIKSSLLSFSEE